MLNPINLFKAASEGVVFEPDRYNQDQTAVENNVNKLTQSTTPGDTGADNITVGAIAGVTNAAGTVQGALAGVKAFSDQIKTECIAISQSITLGDTPVYKTFVDEATLDGDVYTRAGLRREDGSLAVEFLLSNKVDGLYRTKTYNKYAADGVTLLDTIVRTLTYYPTGTITEV